MQVGKNADADDDRPPICPACGVTMGITIDEEGSTRYVCLECGFSDDSSKGSELRASDFRHAAKMREFGGMASFSWGAAVQTETTGGTERAAHT